VRSYSAAGQVVAERTGPSTLFWLDGDTQGTALLEVNAASGAVTRRHQDPFGNPRGASPAWSIGHGCLGRRATGSPRGPGSR
jgi:hypothetical protein